MTLSSTSTAHPLTEVQTRWAVSSISRSHRQASAGATVKRVMSLPADALAKYANNHGWEVDALTSRQIERHLRDHADGSAPGRWYALDSYYTFLVERNRREGNPMARVPRPKAVRRPPAPITDVAERIRKMPEPDRSMATLLYETSMTIAEMKSIDRQERVGNKVVVVGGRSGQRVIWLSADARAALQRLRKLLPGSEWKSARTIQRRLAEAGLTSRRLRHTLGFELADDGVDEAVIGEVMGHRTSASARVYTSNFGKPVSPERVQQALEQRRRGR